MQLRDKILAASKELFGKKGYEATTVADIIDMAGASKGGFYHHFKSKEEILEEMTMIQIATVRDMYHQILEENSTDVIQKFENAYYRLGEQKAEAMDNKEAIRNTYIFEGNHKLLKMIGDAFEHETTVFFNKLIDEGVAQGIFKVDYPKSLARLWSREVTNFHRMTRKLLMTSDIDKDFYDETLAFNEGLINSSLGLEPGTIKLVKLGNDYFRTLEAAMRGKDDDK